MRVCSGPGSQRQSAAEVLLWLPQRLSAHVALAVVRGGIVETDVDVGALGAQHRDIRRGLAPEDHRAGEMFLRRVLAWRVELLHVRKGGTDCLGLRPREMRVPFGAGGAPCTSPP